MSSRMLDLKKTIWGKRRRRKRKLEMETRREQQSKSTEQKCVQRINVECEHGPKRRNQRAQTHTKTHTTIPLKEQYRLYVCRSHAAHRVHTFFDLILKKGFLSLLMPCGLPGSLQWYSCIVRLPSPPGLITIWIHALSLFILLHIRLLTKLVI